MSLRAWRYGWRYGVGLKRRKASQTRRLARLETADFVMFLVAGAGFCSRSYVASPGLSHGKDRTRTYDLIQQTN